MPTDDMQQQILDELKKIRKLMLLLATRGDSQKDRIIHLDQMGFDQLEIAHMLTETPGCVRRVLNAYYRECAADE